MIAIIISHNQKDFISKMSNAIGNEIEKLFVLDRCFDNSVGECRRLGLNYVWNSDGTGRQCSRVRNMGAAQFPNDDILFFDGDRVPLFDVSELDKSPFDVTLVKNQIDIRDDVTRGSWVPEPLWGSFHNGLFGSCVLIRRSAINKVIEKYGHLFDEDFTEWGEEDRHLGDLLHSVGATCGFAGDEMRVLGRATLSNERRGDFENMAELRVKKIMELGLDYLLDDPTLISKFLP